jgi:hypothetical protein
VRAIDELVAQPLGLQLLSGTPGRRRSLHARVHEGQVRFVEQTPARDQSHSELDPELQG